ncbi:hypothetical protein L208DRAFT_147151 [Tricholoma matsutake]|nr:hypothetical protein L208DRAFT_147151 [Tricholoma matsutake 945]
MSVYGKRQDRTQQLVISMITKTNKEKKTRLFQIPTPHPEPCPHLPNPHPSLPTPFAPPGASPSLSSSLSSSSSLDSNPTLDPWCPRFPRPPPRFLRPLPGAPSSLPSPVLLTPSSIPPDPHQIPMVFLQGLPAPPTPPPHTCALPLCRPHMHTPRSPS